MAGNVEFAPAPPDPTFARMVGATQLGVLNGLGVLRLARMPEADAAKNLSVDQCQVSSSPSSDYTLL